MSTEKQFVEGLYIELKQFQNGGEIIKVGVSPKFLEYYESNKNDAGYINIDLKKNRDGDKVYAELNTFKKDVDLPF